MPEWTSPRKHLTEVVEQQLEFRDRQPAHAANHALPIDRPKLIRREVVDFCLRTRPGL